VVLLAESMKQCYSIPSGFPYGLYIFFGFFECSQLSALSSDSFVILTLIKNDLVISGTYWNILGHSVD